MRAMLKINKRFDDNGELDFLVFQTIAKTDNVRKYNKSSSFYIAKEELNQLIENDKQVIAKDTCNFAVIRKWENDLFINFNWLDSGSGVKYTLLRGYIETIIVDYDRFIEFILSDKNELKLINKLENKKAKIEILCHDKIGVMIKNPIMKKKIAKGIGRFADRRGEIIRLYSDFIEYSFYWEEVSNKDGKRIMNGGLIFHKSCNDPENLKKGRYSVHT